MLSNSLIIGIIPQTSEAQAGNVKKSIENKNTIIPAIAIMNMRTRVIVLNINIAKNAKTNPTNNPCKIPFTDTKFWK